MSDKKSKRVNFSIFIPHLGCPFTCVFCNQNKISNTSRPPSPSEVTDMLSKTVKKSDFKDKCMQIAFFGGSFTAIDENLMLSYLKAAAPFIGDGLFDSIRISTRPDFINTNILKVLKQYNVKSIELGIQSLNDHVLGLSKRKYTAEQAINAAQMVLDGNFELGMQMMCGLPGDTPKADIETAKKIIKIGCQQVRIYPALVISGTELHEMYNNNKYTPLSIKEALDICSELYNLFTENNITILKIGLQDNLGVVCGPFHPAFGQLVRSLAFAKKICKTFPPPPASIELYTSHSFLSTAIGNKKSNYSYFSKQGYNVHIKAAASLKDEQYLIKIAD